MFHPNFINDHEPFTWLAPAGMPSRVSHIFRCAYTPYSERELVSFRRIWLFSTVMDFSTPLLPEKGSVAEYLERGR